MFSFKVPMALAVVLPTASLLAAQQDATLGTRTPLGDTSVAPSIGTTTDEGDAAAPVAEPRGAFVHDRSLVSATFYWGDYDGDGLADAYAVQPDGVARLLHNAGDGSFDDATATMGLRMTPLPTAAAWSDFDGDGRQDLFLYSASGEAHLLRNDKVGGFLDWTTESGIRGVRDVQRAAWIDVEGDGLLDLHVVTALGNQLFHNTGGGAFERANVALPPVQPVAPGIAGSVVNGIGGAPAGAGAPGAPGQAGSNGAVPPGALATTTQVVTINPVPTGPFLGSAPVCYDTITDDATGMCIQASSDPTLGMLYPLGTEFFISPAGNVGIGTLSPARKLHIRNGASGGVPSANSSLVVESNSEASISLISPIDEEASLFLGNASSGPNAGAVVFNPFDGTLPNGLALRTADTNRISISSTGDVGIGTNSPTKTLHVSGGPSGATPSTNSTLVVENDSEASISVISPVDEEASLFLGNASSGANAGAVVFNPFDGTLPNGLAIRTADTNRISISSTGNIGIGTNSPTKTLHVSGGPSGATPTVNSTLVVENDTEASISVISPTNQEASLFLGNASAGANAGAVVFNPFGGAVPNGMVLRTDDANRLAITAAGKVGIGTNSPSHLMTIQSTDEETLRLIGPDGSFGWGARINFGDADRAYIDEDVDDSLTMSTTGRIAFMTGGNVGVNTLTPTFKLEVNGTAGKPGGGSWSVSSDARLKKNVHTLEGSLDKLLALRGVSFEYKDPEAVNELPGERIGFIAQEVETVVPDWVEEIGGYKRLTIRGFEALAVEALRELDEQNSELRRQNEVLAGKVAHLEQLQSELEILSSKLEALMAAK